MFHAGESYNCGGHALRILHQTPISTQILVAGGPEVAYLDQAEASARSYMNGLQPFDRTMKQPTETMSPSP